MSGARLLHEAAWTQVRAVWQAIGHLSGDEQADWDGLRLWLEDFLLGLSQAELGVAEDVLAAIVTLFHLKMDQLLSSASRSRQTRHPMYLASGPSGTTSIHYKAARLMEKRMSHLLPDLPLTDQAAIGSEVNTELVVALIKQQPTHAEELVDLLILMAVPTPPWQLWEQVSGADRYRLALAGLQSGNTRVLEAALRESLRLKDAGLIPALAERLEGREHHPLAPKIVEVLAAIPDSTVLPHLAKLALSDVDDYSQDPDYYYPTRLAAMRAMASHDRPEVVIPSLKQILGKDSCGIQTQLTAIQLLADLGEAIGYDIAVQALDIGVSKNYDEVRDLAADALAAIGNPEAIPYLKGAIDHALRLNTSLERYGAILTPSVPQALRHAVEALGGSLEEFSP